MTNMEQRIPCGLTSQSFGIALVLVLWVIVILTVMAASFSLNMRREIDLVRNAKEKSIASPIAEAGIVYAMLRLMQTDPEKQWRSDGSVYEFLFSGARVRVSIYDESGKFDLNNTPDTLLVSLMENNGLSYEEAIEIVDAILDWKDEDDFKRINGAEQSEYEDAGLNYSPRNHPFQTVQELQLVLGVSGELYRSLKDVVTVYNEAKGIDPTRSSRKVLQSLPDVTEEIIDIYLQERAFNAENDLPAPVFPVPVTGLKTSQGKGTTFSVYSEALFPDGEQAGIYAVIKKASTQGTPFEYLDWKRKFPGKDSLFDESVVVFGEDDLDDI